MKSRLATSLASGLAAGALAIGLLSPPEAAASRPAKPTASRLQATSNLVVPLTIHVATTNRAPVVSQRRMRESIARANAELRHFGIELEIRAVEPLREGYSRVTGADHRLALAELAHRDGSVHVFWVERVALDAQDEQNTRVSGIHWRYFGLRKRTRQREYVVVAHDAPLTTLVHELGHAFGLGHRRAASNLMCSCQRSANPGFTARQGRLMRVGARRFLVRSNQPRPRTDATRYARR
ncbi:MAG: hypothetical protein B7733_10690 [Myxococcales bacterium FL481]|nr:MAG: hypothetical protein B7733_10690 [Myxococcales bacterium FL481]